MAITQKQLLKNYQLRFDELNVLENTMFADLEAENKTEADKEEAKRKFEDSLFWFFVDGYSSGMLQLTDDEDFGSIPNGYEFLDIRYPDGETVLEKFDKHYDNKDTDALINLAESEAGRMFNTGSTEAVKNFVNASGTKNTEDTKTASGIMKTWCAILDNKTRFNHEILDGTRIPFEDVFVSPDGDEGFAPCMFNLPENNARCRCILLYSFMV